MKVGLLGGEVLASHKTQKEACVARGSHRTAEGIAGSKTAEESSRSQHGGGGLRREATGGCRDRGRRMLCPKRRVGARARSRAFARHMKSWPPHPLHANKLEKGKPLPLQAFLQFQRPLLTESKLALTGEVPGPSYILTKGVCLQGNSHTHCEPVIRAITMLLSPGLRCRIVPFWHLRMLALEA